MSYSHYGKQAEVWKHLSLCDVIAKEQPPVYVETNSAYADYHLSHSPEQEYGIYRFLEKGKSTSVGESLYFQLEQEAMQEEKYIGSPGLAMSILKGAARYIFFDLDEMALQSIHLFAGTHGLTPSVELHHQDSIAGMMELLPLLPKTALIHIDPYTINEPGPNGYTYLDVFEQAVALDLKCILWYGYQTLDEKDILESLIRKTCKENRYHVYSCHALTLKIIEKETLPCSPGVLGSGLLTGNLSMESRNRIDSYSSLLTTLYECSMYKQYNGELYKEIIL